MRGNVGNISKGKLLDLEIFFPGDDAYDKIMVSYKETKINSRNDPFREIIWLFGSREM